MGHIINLMTNDAQRLDEYIVPSYVILNIHVVLIGSFLLMYREIGIYGTLAGLKHHFLLKPCGREIVFLILVNLMEQKS